MVKLTITVDDDDRVTIVHDTGIKPTNAEASAALQTAKDALDGDTVGIK